jgi:hypothetical protein
MNREQVGWVLVSVAGLVVAGCATPADFTSAARRRAAIDWGCDRPEVKAQVVTEGDEERTVRASGCGKEGTYKVKCKRDVGEASCVAEPATPLIDKPQHPAALAGRADPVRYW